MKNGKRPTKREKIHINPYKLDPKNWLIYKKGDGRLHLIQRRTNSIRVIPTAYRMCKCEKAL
ncbi:hypothetical protein [Bacillus sp. FDAARGOS_1420]|uniref:DUF6906 family protein n=1 Tax=Bacillus sp. FDAARGOS_1420 TaxID=2856338 RepID=UPI001C5B5E84|nr:hypothetical protein [Bacillus sp. FDAARGOS_1420]MBW3492405.1 hypothetical protein [Bacillus sp. FDAARGOS_1420]